MSSIDELPPYFNLSPDRALAGLGAPETTADFARLAEACRAGREDLIGRGLDASGTRKLRPFSTWEITKYLIPVAPAHTTSPRTPTAAEQPGRPASTSSASAASLCSVRLSIVAVECARGLATSRVGGVTAHPLAASSIAARIDVETTRDAVTPPG